VEASIKLAIQYHRASSSSHKTKIIGRHASYHGNTLAGLAAGGFLYRREPYRSVLANTSKAAPAHCSSCFFGLTPQTCALECAASVEQAILAEGPETVAAFIAEPVVGAALSGAVPDARYFAAVREICDRHNVLLIADEVMSGFGRTGLNFAVKHWNIEPDIIVAGKAMSAGYFPISALLVHQRISARLEKINQPFQNGHTHACSPLASAVGLHVLDRIEADCLMENARARGAEILEALRQRSGSGWIANPRGLGLMIGFDLLDTSVSPPAPRPGLADLFHRLALAHGLIVYPSSGSACSETGEHVLLLPPLNIDAQHTRVIIDAITEAQRDIEGLVDGPVKNNHKG
jgi:adenosylmethionine-8-amino-7-oxononanoate aminotransferase